jgi:hypothetical protein
MLSISPIVPDLFYFFLPKIYAKLVKILKKKSKLKSKECTEIIMNIARDLLRPYQINQKPHKQELFYMIRNT